MSHEALPAPSTPTKQELLTINTVSVSRLHRCPHCGELISINIKPSTYLESIRFPFPHVHIHGEPQHAVIVYIDMHFSVRGIEAVSSLEFEHNLE